MRVCDSAYKLLPTLGDKTFHMVLTDVPYDLDEKHKKWLHKQFLRLCSGVIVVFSSPENQWIIPADQYLFWIKPISTKNTSKNYSRFVEMIFVYGNNVWNSDRHWSQYTNVFTDLVDDSNIHQYRKPPSLIRRLILNHTNTGDKILDPFAGSFVVADVAEGLDRECYAIEKDRKLYELYGS